MTALVSIGMSVFNGEATLASAIESIINQGFAEWELIIIDDGSSDRSLEIARSYEDSRIRVFHDGVNMNLAARLNQAVELGEGKYFARMDQDDLSFPERLDHQFQYLEAHPEVDLTASSAVIFDSGFQLRGILHAPTSHEAICKRPWNGFHLPHSSWMGRMEWFRANPYRSEADRAEDQDLLFRTYTFSRFSALDEVLLAYQQDSRSLKKLFLKRIVVLKRYGMEALRRRRPLLFLMVAVVWPAKMLADLLNVYLGIKSMRNKLLSTPEPIKAAWLKLLENLPGANATR